jgi:isopentenyl-diphosphate Delta-isomerase
MIEKVVLVDEKDSPIGLMEKMKAHMNGSLHRAVSVFIFNSNGEMLLQKRALHKYHSAGIWSNAACTHPKENETTLTAAKRRLMEEIGLESELDYAFSFIYKAHLDNGLIEHELDHVFIGFSDNSPKINQEEVCDWKYISESDLKTKLISNPDEYSEWFKICNQRVFKSAKLALQ